MNESTFPYLSDRVCNDIAPSPIKAWTSATKSYWSAKLIMYNLHHPLLGILSSSKHPTRSFASIQSASLNWLKSRGIPEYHQVNWHLTTWESHPALHWHQPSILMVQPPQFVQSLDHLLQVYIYMSGYMIWSLTVDTPRFQSSDRYEFIHFLDRTRYARYHRFVLHICSMSPGYQYLATERGWDKPHELLGTSNNLSRSNHTS